MRSRRAAGVRETKKFGTLTEKMSVRYDVNCGCSASTLVVVPIVVVVVVVDIVVSRNQISIDAPVSMKSFCDDLCFKQRTEQAWQGCHPVQWFYQLPIRQ